MREIIEVLPHLIGAIDRAVITETGKKSPFMLIVFDEGRAAYATNVSPAGPVIEALKQLVRSWDDVEGGQSDVTG